MLAVEKQNTTTTIQQGTDVKNYILNESWFFGFNANFFTLLVFFFLELKDLGVHYDVFLVEGIEVVVVIKILGTADSIRGLYEGIEVQKLLGKLVN